MEEYTAENFALVIATDLPFGYCIFEIKYRACLMIDDNVEALRIVDKLLNEGAEIFEDIGAFYAKYPNFNAEERKVISMLFFDHLNNSEK